MIIDEIILESVEDASLESELNVLTSITESYRKALNILDSCDYNESIVQETFSLYTESVDENGKSVSSIRNLLRRVIDFFKNALKKLQNLISRVFNRNKKIYKTSYNFFLIVDEFNRVFSTKNFNEYVSGEIDEDVFMEGLFSKKNENVKEMEEHDKQNAQHEKQLLKEQKKHEKELEKRSITSDELKKRENKEYRKEFEGLVRQLRRSFKPDMFVNELSRNDIRNIVNCTLLGATKEELSKLNNAVKQITAGDMEHVDEELYQSLNLITDLGLVTGHKKFGNIADDQERVATNSTDGLTTKQNSTDGLTTKQKMDLKLWDEFANTFGTELNHLAKKDIFSPEKLRLLLESNKKIIDVPKAIGLFTTSAVFNLVTRCAFALSMFNPKKIIQDIQQCGIRLNKLHDEFYQYAEEDTKLRKELGIRLNKTMEVMKFGVIDNICEETYRFTNCPFNTQSYNHGNTITQIAGGPITLTYILISMIIFKRPLENFYPSITTMAMMGLAKNMTPRYVGTYKDY